MEILRTLSVYRPAGLQIEAATSRIRFIDSED